MTRHRHRHHGPVRLSRRLRFTVYLASLALLLSGLAWLYAHYLIAGETADEISSPGRPIELWSLKVHGAAMMLALVVVGSLLPVHIARAWHQRRRHLSGILVLGLAFLLTATGYLLYYGPDDELRSWISASHWVLGLCALPVLILHRIAAGRQRQLASRLHHPGQVEGAKSSHPVGERTGWLHDLDSNQGPAE